MAPLLSYSQSGDAPPLGLGAPPELGQGQGGIGPSPPITGDVPEPGGLLLAAAFLHANAMRLGLLPCLTDSQLQLARDEAKEDLLLADRLATAAIGSFHSAAIADAMAEEEPPRADPALLREDAASKAQDGRQFEDASHTLIGDARILLSKKLCPTNGPPPPPPPPPATGRMKFKRAETSCPKYCTPLLDRLNNAVDYFNKLQERPVAEFPLQAAYEDVLNLYDALHACEKTCAIADIPSTGLPVPGGLSGLGYTPKSGTETTGGSSNQTTGGDNNQTTGGGSNQTTTGGSNQTTTGGSNQTTGGGSNQTTTGGSNQTTGGGSNQTTTGGNTLPQGTKTGSTTGPAVTPSTSSSTIGTGNTTGKNELLEDAKTSNTTGPSVTPSNSNATTPLTRRDELLDEAKTQSSTGSPIPGGTSRETIRQELLNDVKQQPAEGLGSPRTSSSSVETGKQELQQNNPTSGHTNSSSNPTRLQDNERERTGH